MMDDAEPDESSDVAQRKSLWAAADEIEFEFSSPLKLLQERRWAHRRTFSNCRCIRRRALVLGAGIAALSVLAVVSVLQTSISPSPTAADASSSAPPSRAPDSPPPVPPPPPLQHENPSEDSAAPPDPRTLLRTFNSRAISDPLAFQEYERAVLRCTWSAPEPLSRVSSRFAFAPRFRSEDFDPAALDAFPGVTLTPWPEAVHDHDHLDAAFPTARTCVTAGGEESDASGTPYSRSAAFPQMPPRTYYVTRIGPITVPPRTLLVANIVPAGPPEGFLVEAMDLPRAAPPSTEAIAAAGAPLAPLAPDALHLHHSQGYQTYLLPARDASRKFEDFKPLASLWKRTSPDFTTPSIFPVAIMDLLCDASMLRERSQGASSPYVVSGLECAYLRLPDGYGLHKQNKTDLWANTMLLNEGDEAVTFVLEHGRRYAPAHADLTPIAPLYFKLCLLCENGPEDFDEYAHIREGDAEDGRLVAEADGVTWVQYVMPSAGHFLSSFIHLHATVLECEVFVWSGSAKDVLTPLGIAQSADPHLTVDSGGPQPLSAEWSVSTARNVLSGGGAANAAAANAATLLCSFRSHAVAVGDTKQPRGAERTDDAYGERCDNWTFEAGQALTIVMLYSKDALATAIRMGGPEEETHLDMALGDMTFGVYAHFPGEHGRGPGRV